MTAYRRSARRLQWTTTAVALFGAMLAAIALIDWPLAGWILRGSFLEAMR